MDCTVWSKQRDRCGQDGRVQIHVTASWCWKVDSLFPLSSPPLCQWWHFSYCRVLSSTLPLAGWIFYLLCSMRKQGTQSWPWGRECGDHSFQQWHLWSRSVRMLNATHLRKGHLTTSSLSSWVHRDSVTGWFCEQYSVSGILIIQ